MNLFEGVHESRGLYRAQIMINGKRHFLGRFTCPRKAHEAYMEMRQKHPKRNKWMNK